jgi:hypothetical protein
MPVFNEVDMPQPLTRRLLTKIRLPTAGSALGASRNLLFKGLGGPLGVAFGYLTVKPGVMKMRSTFPASLGGFGKVSAARLPPGITRALAQHGRLTEGGVGLGLGAAGGAAAYAASRGKHRKEGLRPKPLLSHIAGGAGIGAGVALGGSAALRGVLQRGIVKRLATEAQAGRPDPELRSWIEGRLAGDIARVRGAEEVAAERVRRLLAQQAEYEAAAAAIPKPVPPVPLDVSAIRSFIQQADSVAGNAPLAQSFRDAALGEAQQLHPAFKPEHVASLKAFEKAVAAM